jgi:hypothetical protein
LDAVFDETKGGKVNLSLRPHLLISHWVPGMFVLMVVVLSHLDWKYGVFIATYAKEGSVVTVSIVLFSIAAFLIGEILDSVRDLLEYIWDKILPEVNWDYLVTAPPDQVERFDNYYRTYYVFNMNLGLAFALSLLMVWLGVVSLPDWACRPSAIVGAVLGLFILLVDAILLRREIARVTKQMSRLEAEGKRGEGHTNSNQE